MSASQSGRVSANINDALIYPNGFFDFEITGLSLAGESVQVVISQPAAMGEGAVYRKYHFDHVWQDFVVDGRNGIIRDPGGVGMTSQLSNDGAASGGGGGGGGCTVGGRTLWDPSLPLLVLVSAMTLIRRRFQILSRAGS